MDDDHIPLTSISSTAHDQETAYHPAHAENAGYNKIAEQNVTAEPLELSKDSSSRNPHNWSRTRRGLLFFVVLWCTSLGDFGSTISGSFKASVAQQFGTSRDTTDHVEDASQFMVGVGGVFAIVLSMWLGRLPVLFWFMVVAFCTAAGAAGSANLGAYVSARIINGFAASAAQGTGLLFIVDMFRTKRAQARMINVWEFVSVLSPYIGPFFAGIMVTSSWRAPFWMYVGVTAFFLLSVMVIGRETWYHPQLPSRRSKPLELIGVEQLRYRSLRPSLGQSFTRAFKTITKPAILLLDIYYLVIMAWIVPVSSVLLQPLRYFEQGVNDGGNGSFEDQEESFHDHFGQSSKGSSFYSFGSGGEVGAFFLAPQFALLFAFGISHLLHRRIDKKHERLGREAPPETRLSVIWIGQPFIVLGLLLFGVFVEKNSHFMLVALAWVMYVFGTLIISVGVATYQAEAFPAVAGEVGAWISFARELGGFILTFVASHFAKAPSKDGHDGRGKGAAASFGAAAALTALVCPLVLLLQFRGERWRAKGWDLRFQR